MKCLSRGDFLLPDAALMEHWAVIACDQFTSQPEYWEKVRLIVGEDPSTLKMILPEAELHNLQEDTPKQIHRAMQDTLDAGILKRYESCFIYVERTLANGTIRPGLICLLDLDTYDYGADTTAPVRATERTVLERIPPRKMVRQGSSLDLSHVLLLCDDKGQLFDYLHTAHENWNKLYDFELMQQGGHIAGWLAAGKAADEVESKLAIYESERTMRERCNAPLLYAVGDGNHSLATAKTCWDEIRRELPPGMDHPARKAVVELESIHDVSLVFEPIHRILKNVNVSQLLEDLRQICTYDGCPVTWFSGHQRGEIRLDPSLGKLPVGILQSFLDDWLKSHPGEIDYIHGEDVLLSLSEEKDCIGFLLPPIEKDAFFDSIAADGVLPRKTFSMGHAQEKRYYLEVRSLME